MKNLLFRTGMLALLWWSSGEALAQSDPLRVSPWFFRFQSGPVFGNTGWQVHPLTDVLVQASQNPFGWRFDLGYTFFNRWEIGTSGLGSFASGGEILPEFSRALSQTYPQYFTGPFVFKNLRSGPSYFLLNLAYTFPVKRWNFHVGLLPGFANVEVANGGVSLKAVNSNERINITWILNRKGDQNYQVETFFTLAEEALVEYRLTKSFQCFLSATYLWTKPNLDFSVRTQNQITGTESNETIRYRQPITEFRLGAGITWRFGKRKK